MPRSSKSFRGSWAVVVSDIPVIAVCKLIPDGVYLFPSEQAAIDWQVEVLLAAGELTVDDDGTLRIPSRTPISGRRCIDARAAVDTWCWQRWGCDDDGSVMFDRIPVRDPAFKLPKRRG